MRFLPFLAATLLAIPAFAQRAPANLPRHDVREELLVKDCGASPGYGVKIRATVDIECAPVEMLPSIDRMVESISKEFSIVPELFRGTTVVFIPAVLTHCGSTEDVADFDGCTDTANRVAIVSLLPDDAGAVLVHELEHVAISLTNKWEWQKNRMHKKLDEDFTAGRPAEPTGD